MAPTEKALTAALKRAVNDVFHSNEKDLLTVRFIRTKVEEELDLKGSFFTEGKWKDKSKVIIKGEAVSCLFIPIWTSEGI